MEDHKSLTISKNKYRVLNYNEIFEEYRTNSNKLNELINKKQSLIQSIDYNKFILDEINRADILDEDLEKLENMQNSLSNFEEISSELSLGSQIISDENIGLISSLLKLKNSIDESSNVLLSTLLTPKTNFLFDFLSKLTIA